MKKITLLFIMVCWAMLGMAQTIATFENQDFEMSGVTITGSETDQEIFDTGATNPVKTGINKSGKCLHIRTKQDEANSIPNWWNNSVNITFDQPIELTDDNRYFHVMHMRERTLQCWLVYADNGNGESVEISRADVSSANEWFDIVCDLKSKMTQVKSIQIRISGNWNPGSFYEPTNFYFDNIELSSNSEARGETYITDSNLLDFEDEEVTNSRAALAVQNVAYTTSMSYDNPNQDALNQTLKCAYFTGNGTMPQWWEGLQVNFKSTVDASDKQYLHIMMKKSVVEEGYPTVISLVDGNGTQSADFINEVLTTEWVDYVVEIPETHKKFKTIYVKFNAASAATECYIDELYIDNDPNPRTYNVVEEPKLKVVMPKNVVGGTLMVKNGEEVITEDTEVESETELTISAKADEGYKFKGVYIGTGKLEDAVISEGTYTYTYVVKKDIEISVDFKKVYEVTVTENPNATITLYDGLDVVASGSEVEEGTELTVNVEVNEGFVLKSIMAGNENITESKMFAVNDATVVTVEVEEVVPETVEVSYILDSASSALLEVRILDQDGNEFESNPAIVEKGSSYMVCIYPKSFDIEVEMTKDGNDVDLIFDALDGDYGCWYYIDNNINENVVYEIKANDLTGLESVVSEGYSYNPESEVLYLNKVSNLEIYNMSGVLVRKVNGVSEVSLSDLYDGIYVLMVNGSPLKLQK